MKLPFFIERLKARNLFPKNVQVSDWHDWTLVSCFDQKNSNFISDSVTMGIDKDPETAFFKSLTEYCERRLSRESMDPVTKITARSDGLAAFPVLAGRGQAAQERARQNALGEAVERFLWSTWWDQSRVSYKSIIPVLTRQAEDIRKLIQEFDLVSINEIQVDDSQKRYRLSILLAETRSGGFVTGGAASEIHLPDKRFLPAFGELLRHLIVVRKMKDANLTQLSFYEKRLYGFGSGEFRSIVAERLATLGTESIVLPGLVADQEVNHSAPEIVKIHRCLFEDQPVFMGGKIERLCI